MKRKQRDKKHQTRHEPGNLSQAAGRTLTSYTVGALPILDRIIARAKLEDFLREFMIEDKRCTVSPVVGTLVLLKNYLVSREPIYGVGDWGRQYVPSLLGLTPCQVASLNDDRVGRCLDRLFDADCPARWRVPLVAALCSSEVASRKEVWAMSLFLSWTASCTFFIKVLTRRRMDRFRSCRFKVWRAALIADLCRLAI